MGRADEIWSSADHKFDRVPAAGDVLTVPDGAPYLHYTTNNTIFGTQWSHVPKAGVPLVADLSSDVLSRPVDFSPFALAYAGAQKNAGPSGITLVIGRRDVMREFTGADNVPVILRYATHATKDSLYNTPNTFGIWLIGEVARWIEETGGLEAMARRNSSKAKRVYDALDARPEIFSGHAQRDSRSEMNLTFRMKTPALEAAFLDESVRRDMIGLKGHRSVGGLRASLYNAVPDSAVDALVELISTFDVG